MALTTLQIKNQAKWIAANSQNAFDKLSPTLKSNVRKGQMSAGLGKGQGGYPGNILEKFAEEIKKKYLKGIPGDDIFNSNKKKYKSRSSVNKLIFSMKKGVAPVTISAEELSKKPSLLSRLIEGHNKLTNELGRPPMQSELMRETESSALGIKNNLPKNLKLTPGQGTSSAAATAASFKAALNRKVY